MYSPLFILLSLILLISSTLSIDNDCIHLNSLTKELCSSSSSSSSSMDHQHMRRNDMTSLLPLPEMIKSLRHRKADLQQQLLEISQSRTATYALPPDNSLLIATNAAVNTTVSLSKHHNRRPFVIPSPKKARDQPKIIEIYIAIAVICITLLSFALIVFLQRNGSKRKKGIRKSSIGSKKKGGYIHLAGDDPSFHATSSKVTVDIPDPSLGSIRVSFDTHCSSWVMERQGDILHKLRLAYVELITLIPRTILTPPQLYMTVRVFPSAEAVLASNGVDYNVGVCVTARSGVDGAVFSLIEYLLRRLRGHSEETDILLHGITGIVSNGIANRLEENSAQYYNDSMSENTADNEDDYSPVLDNLLYNHIKTATDAVGEKGFTLLDYSFHPGAKSEKGSIFKSVAVSFVGYLQHLCGKDTEKLTQILATRNGVKGIVQVLRLAHDKAITTERLEGAWRAWITNKKTQRFRMGILGFMKTVFSKYLWNHWPALGLIMFAQCVDSISTIMQSFVFGELFTSVEKERPYWDFWRLFIILIAYFAINLALTAFQLSISSRLTIRLVAAIRRQLLERLHSVSPGFFLEFSGANLLAAVTNDVQSLETGVSVVCPMLVSCVLSTSMAIISCFYFEWRVTLIALFLAAIVQIGPGVLTARSVPYSYEKTMADLRLLRFVKEATDAYVVNRVYGLHEHLEREFEEELEAYYHQAFRGIYYPRAAVILLKYLPQGIIQGCICAMAVLMWYGILTVGSSISYVFLLVGTTQGLTAISIFLPLFVQAAVGLGRLRAFINDHRHTLPQADDPVSPSKEPADILLKDIEFGYGSSGPSVLTNVSVEIKKGSSVVFVGESGVGKSTLLGLLLRLYDPRSGCVTLDRVNLRSIDPTALCQSIGVVLQENHLFRMSLRENIRMGHLQATDSEIENAARASEIHDFVVSLPHGYDTLVDERGLSLSGGQRQRVAIARMLVRSPTIIILDEVTASLDAITERTILESLRELTDGKTSIAVTHRLSQARVADRIYVLDDGHVIESGTHDELLKESCKYAELWRKYSDTLTSEQNDI